jgi:hypothetical protein
MKLVPFFLQKHETSLLTVYRLTLFLTDGGKSLWDVGQETNECILKLEYLEENGLFALSLFQSDDIYFAKLDPQKTNKHSFYTWEELQEIPEKRREECFRTFTFCFEQPQEKVWFRSEICEQPFEGRQETPFAVFQGLKNSYNKKIE